MAVPKRVPATYAGTLLYLELAYQTMKNQKEDKNQQMKQHKNDPATVPATKQDKGVSNDANFKGAVNTGQAGTKPTASQQQGQGAKNAKDHNTRSGSDSGQNTNKKDR